jgi:hypothetical protein
VFISVKAFLNTERGELGQTVRQRAAQDELQQFFQTSVVALPQDARLDALSGVRDAATTVGQGGLPMFRAIDATRRDLRGTFAFDTGLLSAEIQRVRVDLQDVQTNLQTQFAGQLAALDSTLSAQLALKADQTSLVTLTAATGGLRRDLDLKADRTIVDGLDRRLDRDLGALGRRLDGIDARLPPR